MAPDARFAEALAAADSGSAQAPRGRERTSASAAREGSSHNADATRAGIDRVADAKAARDRAAAREASPSQAGAADGTGSHAATVAPAGAGEPKGREATETSDGRVGTDDSEDVAHDPGAVGHDTPSRSAPDGQRFRGRSGEGTNPTWTGPRVPDDSGPADGRAVRGKSGAEASMPSSEAAAAGAARGATAVPVAPALQSNGAAAQAGSPAVDGEQEAEGSDEANGRVGAASPGDASGRDASGDSGRQSPPSAHAQTADPDVSRPSVRVLQSALAFAGGVDGVWHAPAVSGVAGPASASSIGTQERVDNLTRLVQSMQVLVRNGIGEAVVRLRPEHLGEVSIAIRVDGKSVSATIRAESAGVREWLHAQEDALRAGMAQQGLSLDRLVIERDGRQRHEEPSRDARRPRTPPRGSQDPERFEVTA